MYGRIDPWRDECTVLHECGGSEHGVRAVPRVLVRVDVCGVRV